ncbi:MAG: flavin monoamine oxidase family protein [Solirubrobacterales bacterium]
MSEAASAAAEAAATGASTDEVLSERAGRLRRRELLAGGAGLALAGALSRVPLAKAATAPRIVIVGAGLAGLTCAYRLKQAGYSASLYEASDRLGGRCWTYDPRDFGGQIAEHGGELIDQGHTQTRQLAQQLGLDLDNLHSAEVNGTEPFYWFDDGSYSFAEATDDLKKIWQPLHKDVSAASYPTLHDLYTQRGFELDHMSITDWINENVPGRMASRLGQLLDVAYNIEYGAECDVQSSLNMLYLLAYSGQGQLRIFGPSNEKYHVRGGNEQIPMRLAHALQGQITTGAELTSIRRDSDGTYQLSFHSASIPDATADRVVLALPFSILRTINYSKAGFSKLKDTAIQELGMGTNSKLHLQFNTRHWNTLGCNGETFGDTGHQNTWEVSRAQPGASGILVDYTGGDIGKSFTGDPEFHAEKFLEQIASDANPVLPGLGDHYKIGSATLDYWTGNPWTKGSYSYWKVGQYTKFAGVERRQEGAVHFCGEHTSIDFQGYLNGAVETGERAANEVITDLG